MTTVTKIDDIDINSAVDIKLNKADLFEIIYSDKEDDLENQVSTLQAEIEQKETAFKEVLEKELRSSSVEQKIAKCVRDIFKAEFEFKKIGLLLEYDLDEDYDDNVIVEKEIPQLPSLKELKEEILYNLFFMKDKESSISSNLTTVEPYPKTHKYITLYNTRAFIKYGLKGRYIKCPAVNISERPEIKELTKLRTKLEKATAELKTWQNSKTKIRVAMNKQILANSGAGQALMNTLKTVRQTSVTKLLNG